jgi:release factor glutamine methyltransferase
MPDLRQLLATAAQQLGARDDAEALLLHVLDRPRSWLFAHADEPAETDVQTAYSALVERRAAGEPVAYLTGRRGFWSLDLEVTPATLIPRADTELLVELALARLAVDAAARVLDLGTGSGAIALALAAERPQARVTATDASLAALAVAQRNARRLGLDRVRFVAGEWFAPLRDEHFDLIVANPPYIESGDAHLVRGDLRFEPASALASGADGLDDLRAIIAAAPLCLAVGGWLLLEHGWQQGAAVAQLLRDAGYTDVFTAQDLEHRDRVSGGRRVART